MLSLKHRKAAHHILANCQGSLLASPEENVNSLLPHKMITESHDWLVSLKFKWERIKTITRTQKAQPMLQVTLLGFRLKMGQILFYLGINLGAHQLMNLKDLHVLGHTLGLVWLQSFQPCRTHTCLISSFWSLIKCFSCLAEIKACSYTSYWQKGLITVSVDYINLNLLALAFEVPKFTLMCLAQIATVSFFFSWFFFGL